MHTRAKGRSGEESAADHLLSLGYTILHRNYPSRMGEIDLVVRDPSGTVAFVEVKAARGGSFGHPAFWVTPGKQRKIARMALLYLHEHGLKNVPCRFDVVTVWNGAIEHLKNAFLAM